MLNILDLIRKKGKGERSLDILHERYAFFKRLLNSNSRALEIIADLENILYKDEPFIFARVVMQSELLAGEVFSIVEDLNGLSWIKYPELFRSTEEISAAVFSEFRKKKKFQETGIVIPLERLSLDSIADVGGKAANLGEVYNRVNLPVPPGFAVSAYACQQFLDYHDLTEVIGRKLEHLDINATERLMAVSKEIQVHIMEAELPHELQKSLLRAVRDLKDKFGEDIRLSVRSSATSEDSEASFAGQHSTVLNVSEKNIFRAYKEVVSSTFNPRAIFYRRRKGYRDQDVIMSVACITMLDAKVSGVMYTLDPNDIRHSVMMITAVWGLAVSVVEGSKANDFYQVDKKKREVEFSEIAVKEFLLRADPEEGIREERVEVALKNQPCLAPSHIGKLVEYGLKLEDHYGYALDIEWAMGHDDRLYIIQARPLRRFNKFDPEELSCENRQGLEPKFQDYRFIMKGGATASGGAASGIAYVLRSDHDFHNIPEGAIVIARQTSPRYVPLMGRIQAIVTDVGSVTGHMAAVAREFRIPALVGTCKATETIQHGEEITVDATNRAIYRGRIEGLLKEKKAVNPMKGSPIYKRVQSALKKIAPLTLTDPKDENFRPDACQTLHDVIRFSHEKAMQEMFRISEGFESPEKAAIPLRVYLPMKIYIVDLGHGLAVDPGATEAAIHDVTSVPFEALLRGMTNKGVSWTPEVGICWRGFGSTHAESVFRDPLKEGCMGEATYAIIGGHYLNFTTRLGCNFATIDTFCGPGLNDNYITFYFKGGAADIGRRSRQALLIAIILRHLGFRLEQKGDMVRGELKKYLSEVLEEKLDMLGRLMGSVRFLDMVLSDDRQIKWYADEFLEGNYTFQPVRA